MPASRAACSGSPFATAPARTSSSVGGGHRDVAPRDGFAGGHGLGAHVHHAHAAAAVHVRQRGRAAAYFFLASGRLGEVVGEALEGHCEIDVLHLDAGGHDERPRREVEDGAAGRRPPPGSTTCWAAAAGTASSAIRMFSRPDHGPQAPDVVDGHPAPRLLSDLRRRPVEQGDRLEPLAGEAGVIGQGLAEVPGAHHRHPEGRRGRGSRAGARPAPRPSSRRPARRTRRTTPGPSGSGRRSGGTGWRGPGTTRSDAVRLEVIQAPQVDRETVGRQLGNLLGGGAQLLC